MSLGGWVLLAVALQATAYAPRAEAQVHADAGAPRRASAARPPSPAAAPPAGPADPAAFPKAIGNPGQLSESVRARLEQRAAARHASGLPLQEPSAAGAPSSLAQSPRRVANDVALRRGQARMRRMLAVETDEGVTILSNRLQQLPEQRVAAAIVSPERATEEVSEESVLDSPPRITETHSLRALGSRPAPAPKVGAAGLGWLVWPFVLFATTGAVVGTLWFRRKTQ